MERDVLSVLHSEGIGEGDIERAEPSIEDTFVALMEKEKDQVHDVE